MNLIENVLNAIRAEPDPAIRVTKLRDQWGPAFHCACALDRTTLPVNANTYSSSLVTQFLIDSVISRLQNKWAMLKAFTTEFPVDPIKPLASGQLKFVTAGATAQTNATNFETGN